MERHATYSPAITPGELEALKSLRAAGEQRGICYKLDPGTENSVLLWEEGVLTGYMTLVRFGGQEAESAAVVDETLRGRGVGGAAVSAAIAGLAAKDAHIYLEVDSQNPAAFHLYQKLGFTVVSAFEYYPMAL